MDKKQLTKFPSDKTLIEINGIHINDSRNGSCGYCGGKKPNPGHCTWGFTSPKMTVMDYQILMDRGWRRCGTYYYKLDFEKSCCQSYTIQLNVNEFQISKSQKKVMKTFNKYLLGLIDEKGNKIEEEKKEKQIDQKKVELKSDLDLKKGQIYSILDEVVTAMQFKFDQKTIEDISNTSIINMSKDKELKNTKSWCTNSLLKLYFLIKKEDKQFTIEQLVQQLKAKENLTFNLQNSDIRLEQNGYLTFINKEKIEKQQKVPPFQKNKKDQNQQQQEEENKQDKKMKNIQKEENKKDKKMKNIQEEEKKNEKQDILQQDLYYTQYFKEHCPLPSNSNLKHKYTVKIVRSIGQKESFLIFKRYQQSIHKDHFNSQGGYENFLCRNPLFDLKEKNEVDRQIGRQSKNDMDTYREIKDEGIFPEYLGGYHMEHRLDGQLFAVGVLDFTPNVLSSVYYFYDPKYEFLSPGIFGAIREIEYMQRVIELGVQDFNLYYMGYYFQDCIKSIYKGNYKPSKVLCPNTYNYVYLDDITREKITKELKPLLSDKETIKEMAFNDKQINTLVLNTMVNEREQKVIKISETNERMQKGLIQMLTSIYQNFGIDLIMSVQFIVT